MLIMPRGKATAREERNNERKKEVSKRISEGAREQNLTSALSHYDSTSRPTLPTSKAERRYLRKGLAERGEKLSTYGCDSDEDEDDDEGNPRAKRVVLPPSDIGSVKGGNLRIDDISCNRAET